MQNAHCRLGRLEYLRSSEKTNTQVFLHVDHYVGDGEQAHLLSLFGGDAEVGAIRAAIYEKHVFTLTFPDGGSQKIGFGPDAECYYGSLSLPGAKRSLRHLVAVSAALHANGTAGQTFLMHLDAETKDLAWATVVLSRAATVSGEQRPDRLAAVHHTECSGSDEVIGPAAECLLNHNVAT
ncbi:MAG TPA: hypothetical protein VGI45_07190, partial [Terracidiphilus sp.]|jgi:hypothetical protein